MFSATKETRSFLQQNFITLQNSLINEGLITLLLESDFTKLFNQYEKLEASYF